MIFNSIEFFVFLPLVYCIYLLLNHKGQNLWLLCASYVFYGWWDPRFLFLIALSTAVDHFCGFIINDEKIGRARIYKTISSLLVVTFVCLYWFGEINSILYIALGAVAFLFGVALVSNTLFTLDRTLRRKLALIFSLTSNLGILAIFKYFNFFIDSAQNVLMSMGISHESLVHLDIILPVGISFYTFQTMSYSIDIYRGKLNPCKSLIDFSLYVAYFPQLVAGPIERATNLLPRIMHKRQITWDGISQGLGLIAYGLFKKVVIADGLAASVASIYGTSGDVSGVDVLIATLFFTIQIYCDFSGYSDIARGVSKLLGIELMLNFKLPYFSRSPSEFWNRWHISLSSWLRDYLYISLGGNRKGTLLTYRNLMLTMVLGGLWHGAAWNYVLWGFYQGTLLVVYRLINWPFAPTSLAMKRFYWLASLTLFFVFTCYGWLLFRAESFTQIITFTNLIVTDLSNFEVSIERPPFSALIGLPILIGFEILSYYQEQTKTENKIINSLSNQYLCMRSIVYALMVFAFVGALSTPPVDFIYFQF